MDTSYTAEDQTGDALYHASFLGLEAVVGWLLEDGADVNARGGTLGNPLQAASVEGNTRIIQTLLSYGADVNLFGGTFGSALQAASWFGHENIVERLLAHDANVHNTQETEEDDEEPENYLDGLHSASGCGNQRIVEMLLRSGADVNAGELAGERLYSALHAASESGHDQIVRILLNHGADVDTCVFGKTALHHAAQKGYHDIVEMLLDSGAQVDAKGEESSDSEAAGTALQIAAHNVRKRVVEILIAHHADVNANASGATSSVSYGVTGEAPRHPLAIRHCTPLQLASMSHKEDGTSIIATLVGSGANVNEDGPSGTALIIASTRGNERAVQTLIAHGAHVNVWSASTQNDGCSTALQCASYCGHVSIVKILLTNSADANANGFIGTALHAALRQRNRENHPHWEDDLRKRLGEVVELLVAGGADVNFECDNVVYRYGTALQAAARFGHDEMTELLLSHGANVNTAGPYGSALYIALDEGQHEVVEVLLAHKAVKKRPKSMIRSGGRPSHRRLNAARPLLLTDSPVAEANAPREEDTTVLRVRSR